MTRVSLVLGAVLALSPVLLALPGPAAAATTKHPPACAAVSFHPFAGPLTASPVTAGHYKSRFGSIDLLGTEDNGQPNYHLQVNRENLTPLSGEVPKSAYSCLRSKHVTTPPTHISGACVGSRFRVVVDSSGHTKLVMLYALKGDDWQLCEAGNPAK